MNIDYFASIIFMCCILEISCADRIKTDVATCTIETKMNNSSLTATYELRNGENSFVFGQGVLSSNFRIDEYRMANGDSCTGPVFHVNVGTSANDSAVRYSDVGAGCVLRIAGSNWFVANVILQSNESNGKVVLHLLPDSIEQTTDSLEEYSELVVLPGGPRHSGFDLSGSQVGVEELDQRIATSPDSVNVVLNEIRIKDDRCTTTEFRPVKVGSVIHTKKYQWEVVKIYLLNVNGVNYSRILVGRK